MKITPINPIKLAWPDWIKQGANSNRDHTKQPPKKTMEPTNTLETPTESESVINHTEEADELTCDQCGQSGFRNQLGLSMHKARLRGDAKHPNDGAKRPPPPSMDPNTRREYARKRYLRVKKEKERQKALVAASAPVVRRIVESVTVGEIQEHPHVCPRCKLDLDAVAAAMNLVRK